MKNKELYGIGQIYLNLLLMKLIKILKKSKEKLFILHLLLIVQ